MEKPTTEVRAAALFQRVGRAQPLSPERLAHVWSRTAPRLSAGRWLTIWVSGGAVLALVLAAAWTLRTPGPTASPMIPITPAAILQPPLSPPVSPRVELALSPLATVRPPRAVARPPQPVEVEDPLLAESRLLTRAVSELREQKNAEASLATLDEYAKRFEQGALRSEAMLTRVEALIEAHKRADALVLLESLDLSSSPRGGELRVLLGELMLEAGRRDSARQQFETALAGRLRIEAEDRASYGLAGSLGQPAAFERYLLRFPQGKFAEAARAHLSED